MAYYYISSTGTATGDAGRFTSLQTGAFTNATSYATLIAARAATTAPVAGDYYLFPDTGSLSINNDILTSADNGIVLVSVDVNNRNIYKAGFTFTSTQDLDPRGIDVSATFRGITFDPGDDSDWVGNAGASIFFDCTASMPITSADPMRVGGGNGITIFEDCQLDLHNRGDNMIICSEDLIMDNCTMTTTADEDLFTGIGGSTDIHLKNTDLTQFILANGSLIQDAMSTSKVVQVNLHHCKLPTGFSLFAASGTAGYLEANITACDQTDGYHYFFHQTLQGQAEEDTTQYLTTSDAKYDGTNRFSVQVDTTARCNVGLPYKYHIASLAAIDLATANQTVSIELTGPAGLTDVDVWIECVYNDDTDEALGAKADSRPAALFATGTALTSSSAVWQVTTDTEYSIDLDLGAFTNTDNTTLDIFVYVAKPSITVNFDMPTIAAT